MSWDSVWEDVFASRSWGRYPPEELIRFVARNYFQRVDRNAVRFLELGCGAGANIWFLAREGFDVHGIDGSASAIRRTSDYLKGEGLRASLNIGDVIEIERMYPSGTFDAVIDVACLWHNKYSAVLDIARQVFSLLKPGGRFFSTLLSRGTLGDDEGVEIEEGTFRDIRKGPLAGRGTTHFFTRDECLEVFSAFRDVSVGYVVRSLDDSNGEFRTWIVQGIK